MGRAAGLLLFICTIGTIIISSQTCGARSDRTVYSNPVDFRQARMPVQWLLLRSSMFNALGNHFSRRGQRCTDGHPTAPNADLRDTRYLVYSWRLWNIEAPMGLRNDAALVSDSLRSRTSGHRAVAGRCGPPSVRRPPHSVAANLPGRGRRFNSRAVPPPAPVPARPNAYGWLKNSEKMCFSPDTVLV